MSGDLAAVPRLLEATGISQIIVRHDLVRGMPGRTFADDRILDAALAKTPGMTRVTKGDLDLWFLGDGSLPTVHAYDAVLPAPARPTAGSSAIGSMPTDVAIAARKTDPNVPDIKKDVGRGGVDWRCRPMAGAGRRLRSAVHDRHHQLAARSRWRPGLGQRPSSSRGCGHRPHRQTTSC